MWWTVRFGVSSIFSSTFFPWSPHFEIPQVKCNPTNKKLWPYIGLESWIKPSSFTGHLFVHPPTPQSRIVQSREIVHRVCTKNSVQVAYPGYWLQNWVARIKLGWPWFQNINHWVIKQYDNSGGKTASKIYNFISNSQSGLPTENSGSPW